MSAQKLPLAPPLVRLEGSAAVRLTRPAAAAVRRFAASGNWPAAYRAVAGDLAMRVGHGADVDTQRWYAIAAEVNDRGSTSFIHFLTRAYLSAEVKRQTGLAVDPAGETVQRCSDWLAETVLGGVAEGRSDCIGCFAQVGPIETKRITRRLVPGLVLDRTVWPAYAQLAWTEADRRFHGLLGRFLPFWRRGLPRWICPADTFEDARFLDDLTDGERSAIRASARDAIRQARACVKVGRWVAG